LANRWRLGIPPAVLLFAALQAFAQGPGSPTWPDCPECQTAAHAVESEREGIARLEAQLAQAKSSLEREQGQASLHKLQDVLRADEKALSDCRTRCALRGALPPLPPEIPLVRHIEPVACPQCKDAAAQARDALYKLAYAEHNYLSARSQAFQTRAWLSRHASATERASDVYFTNLGAYLAILGALSKTEKELADSLAAFDKAALNLANCNASLCDDAFKAKLGTQPLVGAADEDPKAECADCEGDALKLKRDLALLRVAKAEIAHMTARRQEIARLIPERELTDAERTEFNQLDSRLKAAPEEQGAIEKQINADRVALDECNRAHPRSSCQPPTGTSITPETGTGGATGPKTSGGTMPQVGPGSANLPGGKSTPEAGVKSGTGAQTPPPPPPGPDTSPRSPENAPPIRPLPPIGSIFAPTPDPVPGARQFNFTMPSKRDNGDGAAKEYLTFIVRDSAGGDEVLALFLAELVDMDGDQWTIIAGKDPDKTRDKLEGLWNRGVIDYVEPDPCWGAAAGDSSVPVSGAWILYTPVSPSPSSDPGESPGDEGPPTIVHAGRDGTYSAPPGGLNGPIEMRVATGCDERTTVPSADRSDRRPVAGVSLPVEKSPENTRRIPDVLRASELRKP
jgi:hypothetical protein